MVDTTAITSIGIAIAIIIVFIGIRAKEYTHNIQDLQSNVTNWEDDIYNNEFIAALQKQPNDPTEVMNIAIKHFTVRSLHKDLEALEARNNIEIRTEIAAIIVLGGVFGFSFLTSPDAPIGLLFPHALDSFVYYVPLIAVSLVGIFTYIWNRFREDYSTIRKKITTKVT